MQYQHTNGVAQPVARSTTDVSYPTSIRITRGATIEQGARRRIIDRSIEVMARDTDSITFEFAFIYQEQEWTISQFDEKVTVIS